MKRVVKLTEQDLYRIVKRVIAEQNAKPATQQASTQQASTQQASTQQQNSWGGRISAIKNNPDLNKKNLEKYVFYKNFQTNEEYVNDLLPDGSSAKAQLLNSIKQAQGGKSLAGYFKLMIQNFLERTWNIPLDLTTMNSGKLVAYLQQDKQNYDTLVTTSKIKFAENDLSNILNKLKDYQVNFKTT